MLYINQLICIYIQQEKRYIEREIDKSRERHNDEQEGSYIQSKASISELIRKESMEK